LLIKEPAGLQVVGILARVRTGFGKSWRVMEIEKQFQDLEKFWKFSFFESGLWKSFEIFVSYHPDPTLKKSTVSIFIIL